jgi:hypothetical protein
MKGRVLLSVMLLVSCAVGFMACEQHVTTESVVSSDGKIDRSVVFARVDSAKAVENIFGLNAANGWDVTMEPNTAGNDDPRHQRYDIKFTRSFANAGEANEVMDPKDNASVFKIRSDFSKRFRWFYTYLRYSDTYVSINRFRFLDQNDYFTVEDMAFIDRLPAEGKPISKADSLYLENLNAKIIDFYAVRAIYEENFQSFVAALKHNGTPQHWLDTVLHVKEAFYKEVFAQKDSDDLEDEFVFRLLDRYPLPVDQEKVKKDYLEMNTDATERVDFMTDCIEGPYTHIIRVPWSILESNADSVQGNVLMWKPPVVKFMLRDYTMYAEGREMNTWAVALSAAVIVITLVLVFRRKNIPARAQ